MNENVPENDPGYPYKPLQGSEIRLLRILPGDFEHDMRCSLSQIRLESAPPFDALSYVWAQEPGDAKIYLEGEAFTVSRNAYLALRQFRALPERAYSERYLWLDAICVDQGNTNEKSTQVPRMGEIYTKASEVVVWLGANKETNTDAVIKGLFDEAEHVRESCEGTLTKGPGVLADEWFAEYPIGRQMYPDRPHLGKHQLGKGLNILYTYTPWFSRMWVVQEASLAARDPLMYYGAHRTTLDSLAVIDKVLRAHEARDVSGNFRPMFRDSPILDIWNMRRDSAVLRSQTTSEEQIRMECMYVAINDPLPAQASPPEMAVNEGTIPQQGPGITDPARIGEFFVQMILRTRQRKSAIAHDTVYGLLGLIGPQGDHLLQDLRASYNDSYAEICHRYTHVLLQATGDLRLINGRNSDLSGMPSWVPDLRYLEGSSDKNNFRSLGSVTTSVDRRSIMVQGAVIGTVCGHLDGDPRLDARSFDPEQWRQRVEAVEGRVLEPSSKLRGVACSDAVRELLRFVVNTTQYGSPSTLEMQTKVWDQTKKGEGVGRYDREAAADMRELFKHAYVVLGDGEMAVAQRTQLVQVQPGDVLCLLRGSPYPTLLRPHHDCYILISHCRMLNGSLGDEDSHREFYTKRASESFTIV